MTLYGIKIKNLSSLTNRIYNELDSWKYAQLYLLNVLVRQNKFHVRLDFGLILTSLIGIVGWFNNNDLKNLWTAILITVLALRISKNIFLKSPSERFSIKSSLDFYSYQIKDLENLFYDYYSGKYSDTTIEKRLRKLQDNERSIFKIQTFGQVKLKNKLQIQIEEEVNEYLEKIKSNLDA